MAKGNDALLLHNIRGHIGKQFVIKQYGDKIVVAKYPSMPKRKKAGALKKLYEDRFRKAHEYASSIIRDPKLKSAYQAKIKPGQRVYNYAMSEYLTNEKLKNGPNFK